MSPLLTDLYQLSMASGYWQLGMHNQRAVFHLFFRRNPLQGDYVIAAGLHSVIDFLQSFHFSDEDIRYLASLNNPQFSPEFLAYLQSLHFEGDIDAVPEGSVVFAHEPLLRIRAPLLLCQLLETPLINFINFSSAVATMASRIRTIAGNDFLMEFGLRRAQGPDGGLTASRSAYLGGFDATSNVLAGKQFHIPVIGTMSHGWVMAFDDELTAFRQYAGLMPENSILLVDTYDTKSGIDHAIIIGNELTARGQRLRGVRLDSGDLGALSVMAREKLNQAGFSDAKIYVSGDLTEERLIQLKSINAPIDGWGVGTHLSTSYYQPALDMVYKLGAIQQNAQWHYKIKISNNALKTSDPGILQVKRFYDKNNTWLRDVIYHETLGISLSERGCDLLKPIFSDGALVYTQPSLSDTRDFCIQQVITFHQSKHVDYLVQKDEKLLRLKQQLMSTL